MKAIDEDDKDFSGRITCSSVTNDHMHRRKGNWITSDSECKPQSLLKMVLIIILL